MSTKFPIEIKRGSVTVRVRCQHPSKQYPDYEVFTLDYHEGGHRQRPSFATLKEARKEAETAAERLARGEGQSLVLTGNERLIYLQALEALYPVGLPLNVAATEYAQATAMLRGKGSVLEASRHFAATQASEIRPIRTEKLVEDLIRTREANHASKRHVGDLRSRLGRFAKSFKCEVHTIRPDQVQDFLTDLKLSPRSMNNFRIAISNLFSHARLRGHVPKDFDPLADMPWAREVDGEVGIYTPDQLKIMFEHARPEMLPYLAIAAFTGLRQAELERLQWEHVKLDHIGIMGTISKKGEIRHVPILPNLAAWLEKVRCPNGPLVPFSNVSNQVCRLAQDASLESEHNGLRHSFGSHRLAVIKNPDQVAYEMGSSKAMIYKHYRKVVEEAQGIRWFSLYPDANLKPVFHDPPPMQAVPLPEAASPPPGGGLLNAAG